MSEVKSWLPKLPGLLIIVVFLAGALWLSGVFSKEEVSRMHDGSQEATGSEAVAFRPVDDTDHIRGEVTAPVTLIEYGDLACPFCQSFHPRVARLLETYPEQVRWVWRHFPHDENVDATAKAVAAECAGEQGQFWEYADALFVGDVDASIDEVNRVADILGLNLIEYETCRTSEKYVSRVTSDIAEATVMGGTSTPFTLLIGPDNKVLRISGAVLYEELERLTGQLLAGEAPTEN